MLSFGATPNILIEFNFYEALFWIVLGLVMVTVRGFVPYQYRRWVLVSAVNILLFGVTDVVELYTGGFLHTARWLLWWKSIHAIGLVGSVWWYIRLRIRVRA
jgi:hypothetical protein